MAVTQTRPAGALARLDERPRAARAERATALPNIGLEIQRYIDSAAEREWRAIEAGLRAELAELRQALEDSRRWPEWLTPAQAAEYLGGVSGETLRRWVTAELPSIRRRSGKTVYYRRRDLDALMERRFPLSGADAAPNGTDL